MAMSLTPTTKPRPWLPAWSVVLLALALVAASCGGTADAESESAADQNAASPQATTSTSTASTTAAPTTPAPTTTTSAVPTTTEPTTTTTAAPTCDGMTSGSQTITLASAGNKYETRIFLPTGFQPGTLTPVVVNWHGLGSTGIQQVALTGYESLADQEGFIVVHPTGPRLSGGGQTSWELDQADIPNRDDLTYANDLLDLLIEDYCADPARIYSTGFSNGGFFTSRLVCEMADRLAAATSIAGASHFDGCSPSRPVPFLAFHGTKDKVIPYSGGTSSLGNGLGIDSSFFDQNMPLEFAQFAEGNGCDPTPEVVVISDEVQRSDYLGCDEDVPMSFYEIQGGGHTWPGSPLGLLLTAFLGKTTNDVDATKLSWDFFSQHSLD